MTHTSALQYLWWLVSDASGVVAIVLISLSVLLGLAMAGGALKAAEPAPDERASAREPRAHGPGGDRGARARAARRSVAETRLARDHDPVRAQLQTWLHRHRHHRGIPRRAARAELLPAPPDRSAPLAKASPGHGDRLDAVSRPRAGRGYRRIQAVAARDRADASRTDRLPAGRTYPRRRSRPGQATGSQTG